VRASFAKLSDHTGYRSAHAWDLLKPLLLHYGIERLGQQGHAFGCSKIGLCTIRIAAIEQGTTAKLIE
jgi:hypothetical protein